MTAFTDPKFTFYHSDRIAAPTEFDGKDIGIDLNVGFDMIEFCIWAKTIGGVTRGIPVQVENCGIEVISFNHGALTKIKRLYSYDEGDEYTPGWKRISLSDEGFSFTSDKPNCPVTTFKMYYDETLTTEYTGTEIQILGATMNDVELLVNTR